jgi:hypothetical protein
VTINLSASQGFILLSVILAFLFIANGARGIVTKRTAIQIDRGQFGGRMPWINLVYEGAEVGVLNCLAGLFILALAGAALLPETSPLHLPANRAFFYEVITTLVIQGVVVVLWAVKYFAMPKSDNTDDIGETFGGDSGKQ